MILALETSCDDTCAAVLDEDGRALSNVISSQHVHDRFGGVVPEIASRHHLELVNTVVDESLREAGATLDDIDLIAATQGPGLVGALLVGLSTGKALAAGRRLPFAPVDHLQGHVAANFLSQAGPNGDAPPFEPPFVCLIASGGHTLLALVSAHDGFEVLGRTLDDAAGEAFDKGARMLGLGYPGGPALSRLAEDGDPTAHSFPGSPGEIRRGAPRKAFAEGLDFSFAGLKTALLYATRELSSDELSERAADLAASYQAAIVESLVSRSLRALERTGLDRLAVGGGVAANDELRRRLGEIGATVHVPDRLLCTDNAAMIASAARFSPRLEYPDYLSLDAYATGETAR
ncbi:MAG TPA: tRNA (adenosine(37)-N6)-threonylcarbamoyltransferase complex transferase subunit TsaD [Solirubrobacteraceae bacterium]|jgi:N6-L-threonylcarbamoyladenine synthase|nr:tRNA (adenosine(37)-N6)-threonylcarbamoyltransferase complex transferase subunit TsaD [Solirubrobacteraceae bacterium]